MKYKFKEANLGGDFCRQRITEVKKLIDESQSFTVVGMPGMGISIFLKYLATRNFAHFTHIDLYELPELSTKELYKKLPSKSQLMRLTGKHQRVVIIFNRFDQLKDQFDKSFFNKLRSIRDIDREKIVMIFSANKPLIEHAPQAFDVGNLNMYATTYCLEAYSKVNLEKIIKMDTPDLKIDEKLLKLSGGHYQLFRLLVKSGRVKNYLLDPFISLQIKSIYDLLSHKQKLEVKKKSFTPLLTEYALRHVPIRLSKKERTLFNLLKNVKGKIVTKDEIFEKVWKNDLDNATDWALNALIYRLRKNLIRKDFEYQILSHKGIGYSLN